MPKIVQMHEVNITPERYLNACSVTELHELQLLLGSPHYQDKMQGDEEQNVTDWFAEEAKRLSRSQDNG